MKLGARTAASRAATAARTIGKSSERKDAVRREFHERIAERYVRELGEMKGALMKIGQLASFIDVGMVPERYRDIYRRAFGTLLAEAPPMPLEVLDEIIEAELGAPAKEAFAWFSPEPIAAASIGQVHEARLDDGTPVAVKVQYPGVADAIDDDLSNIELLATFFRLGQSMLGGLAPKADPRVFASEMRERVSEELDYEIEARNQIFFRKLYADHPFIRIPRVFEEYSTPRVLTMELVHGRRWAEALQAPDDLRQRWAEVIYRFAFGSLDRFAVFNADPHPGNYLFHDDGSVTFLDFGCVKLIPPERMRLLIAIIRATAEGRAADLKRAIIEAGFLSPDDDLDPERILEWFGGRQPHLYERPYRFTHEDVAAFIRRTYDPRGAWGDVSRRFVMPKDNVLLTRIDLGLWSIFASLEACNDWVAIGGEIWGVGPPATELGRLDAEWQARMWSRDDWPPAHPERRAHFEPPPASLGFDPLTSDFQSDPYADYSELRAQGRVHWVPPGLYLVPRYEDCLALIRDPRLSSDPARSEIYNTVVLGMWGEGSAIDRMTRRLMLFMDPPDHTRLRLLVADVFTRRAVESLRPRIEAIATELLDRCVELREFDLVSDFAYPLPIRVIAELLGVPFADRDRFGVWSRELVGLFGADVPSDADVAHGNATVEAFLDYFRELSDERRRKPREDLLSALTQVEQAGERLSTDELLAMCLLLLIAGHETTANLIGNGTVALLRNPHALERLRDEPAVVTRAVEELLRYDSPVQATARTTLEDISIGSRTIGPGQRVVLLLGSANRDPHVFEEPDRLLLDRDPNQHLAFGGGIHFCLGAPLARIEGRVAFSELARRMPGLQLASDEVEWKPTFPIRGPRRLQVESS